MMSYRIALLCSTSFDSGLPRRGTMGMGTLAGRLRRAGYDVHVLVSQDGTGPRYAYLDGVHYHRCPGELRGSAQHHLDDPCERLVLRLTEIESFYGWEFDVIHGHDRAAVKALPAIRRLLGRPLVLSAGISPPLPSVEVVDRISAARDILLAGATKG